MSMLSEFKEFISKGNVIDLAVGVIIGAAFGKIVTSFVDDIIMPPIGYILGGIDFANKKIILVHADVPNKVTEVAIRYGNFVNTVIQFLIIAFCVFILIKGINALKRQKEAEAAAAHVPTEAENLLAEIRDILRSQRSI